MIRFCDAGEEDCSGYDAFLTLNPGIWREGRQYFKQHREADKVPVLSGEGELLCFAYQDKGANRQLRMLQELEETPGRIPFCDVYQDYDFVVIYGCNELAYYFAEYLQAQKVKVDLIGKYWDRLDIVPAGTGKGQALTIWAEGTWEHSRDLRLELLRSVSVQFECIDHIYAKNITSGIIKNAMNGFWLASYLKDKDVIILGIWDSSQDAYELLYSNGIDIAAFLDDSRRQCRLLGKEVIDRETAQEFQNPVFIDAMETNSVLGSEEMDEYVYFGCRRNVDFFYLRDYMDVQRTNLVHLLCGRNLVLMGDELMCHRLGRVLGSFGHKQITYYEELREDFTGADVLGVIVVPEIFGGGVTEKKAYRKCINDYKQQMKEHRVYDYTEYYSKTISFTEMDCETEKYRSNELRPKGILLGAMYGFCGSLFFRGCIDNHPNVMQMGYDHFENNLFYYCIRLAETEPCAIMPMFWKMLEKECDSNVIDFIFRNKNIFEERCRKELDHRDDITSQELFVLFFIAYNEMRGRVISDVSKMVIYWEPHGQPADLCASYAKWLGDRQIRGITVRTGRNSLVRAGSRSKYTFKHYGVQTGKRSATSNLIMTYQVLERSLPTTAILTEGAVGIDRYDFWDNIYPKFENLKLSPKEEFGRICEKLNIPWSDTLLETTSFGKISYYSENITGYDLKPVYNDYSDWLSMLDKLRIAMATYAYQKFYGYPYEDCLCFSRVQIQELFMKEYRLEKRLEFQSDGEKTEYYIDSRREILKLIRKIYDRAVCEEIDSVRHSSNEGKTHFRVL